MTSVVIVVVVVAVVVAVVVVILLLLLSLLAFSFCFFFSLASSSCSVSDGSRGVSDGIGRYSILNNEKSRKAGKYLSMIDGKAIYFRYIIKHKKI
jgi:hypothetical protein